LELNRQPFPKLEAIYFITPVLNSVQKLIDDYEKPKLQYAGVHIFWTSHLADALLQKVGECSKLSEKIITMKEINLEFLAVEQQCYHLDNPDIFKNIFGEKERELVVIDLKTIGQKLATVVATLGEKPYIRYLPDDKNSETIAKSLEEKLSSIEYEEAKERGTVFIFDRKIDLIAPVVHEFTYQAMIYDLLEVSKDVYKYIFQNNAGAEQEKSVLLGEVDQLWPVLRHKHIADTIAFVIDNFNEFVRTNKAVQLQTKKKEVQSLKEMGEAMKAMPQYQELLNKYSLHIHMAGQCMKVFKHKQLDVLGLLEQEMANGEDEKGNKSKNVVSKLTPHLSDPQVSQEEKLRLLMLYVASQEGVSEGDRKALADKASLSNEERIVLNAMAGFFAGKEKAPKEKKKKDKKEKKKK